MAGTFLYDRSYHYGSSTKVLAALPGYAGRRHLPLLVLAARVVYIGNHAQPRVGASKAKI